MVLLLRASIAMLIFAIGLSSTLDDVTFVWRHPSFLLRSLLAMYVVVPGAAILMAKVLDLPWGTELALVVLAICAGAPLLPKKVLNLGGDPSYIFTLVVTTSVLAIGTVPYGVRLGLPSLLAFAVFVAVSLEAGHWLGGPDPAERTSLAVACASRHVGLALLVATSYRGEKAIAIVAAYLIASAAVSIP